MRKRSGTATTGSSDERPVDPPADSEVRGHQHGKADERVEEGRAQAHHGQDLEREHDAFHVVRRGHDQAGRAHQALAEQGQDDHAAEEHHRELAQPAGGVLGPAGVEHDPEDEGEDGEKEDRVQEGPEQAQEGAAITRADLPLDELPDERSVAEEVPDQADGVERRAGRNRPGHGDGGHSR